MRPQHSQPSVDEKEIAALAMNEQGYRREVRVI